MQAISEESFLPKSFFDLIDKILNNEIGSLVFGFSRPKSLQEAQIKELTTALKVNTTIETICKFQGNFIC